MRSRRENADSSISRREDPDRGSRAGGWDHSGLDGNLLEEPEALAMPYSHLKLLSYLIHNLGV